MNSSLSTLLSKVVTRVRRDGPWLAARYSFDTLKHGAHYLLYDRRWDRFEHHRSSGATLVREDDIIRPGLQGLRCYQAAPRLPLLWAIRALRIDPAQYIFIDYGSGRGRVLLTAARFPFKQVIGIEFSRTLHQEACENIAHYPRDRLASSNMASLNMNAVDFDLPDENCILFFFNPFTGELLDRVAERIEESWRRSPRSILVVFENSGRAPLFVNRPLFHRINLPIRDALHIRVLAARPFEFFTVGTPEEIGPCPDDRK